MTTSTATSERDTLKVLRHLFEERTSDGFILLRTAVKDTRVGLSRDLDVLHILYGRTGYGRGVKSEETSWFDIAGETTMRKAVLRLAGFGHARIGYVGSDPKFNYSHLRRDGYLEGLREAGLKPDAALTREGARTRDEGAAQAMTLMNLNQPPTAIVFATDLAALGFCTAAQGQGLKIGRDVSVIGYNSIPECRNLGADMFVLVDCGTG